MPGLDGLRALAVAGVVMFHLPLTHLQGGFAGVDLFLVLSGFLITSLLMAEAEGTGRIRLGTFWMRRVRRLVPALVVMLVASAAWLAVADWDALVRTRTMLLAGAGYVTNWYQVAVPWVPWNPAGREGLYEHLWSLAVEEQFYLVWPLVLSGVMVLVGVGRRTLFAAVVAGAAASVAVALVMFDGMQDAARVYLGTDTRAIALLVGIALAVALPPARFTTWKPSSGALAALEVAGAVGLLGVIGFMLAGTQASPWLYEWGFLVIALLGGLLVITTAHPATSVSRLFAIAPLAWIGARSYGIYLWHLPVIYLCAPRFGLHLPEGWLALVQVALTVVIAALSYRFVERPIRVRGFRGWLRPAPRTPGA